MQVQKLGLTIGLLLLGIAVLAGPKNYPYEKTKSFTERFTVQNNVQVTLDNLFGNIKVDTWDKNVVSIEVIVTVEGDKEQSVERQLNLIDVIINGGNSTVSSITKIENLKVGKWQKMPSLEYSIHYKVKMPKSGNLNLINKYGDVMLDELMGSSSFTVKYGSLQIDNLAGKENNIALFYGRGSEIGNCANATVALSYSGIEIDNGGKLNVSTKYSDIDINKAEKLKYFGRYDKLTIQDCDEASINSKYSTLKIENLINLLDADIQHSNLIIDNVANGFETIKVTSSYGPVIIAFGSDANFEFNTNGRHCGVTTPANAKLTNKQKDYSYSSYKGYVGNQGATSKVSVTSEYGSIKLKVD